MLVDEVGDLCACRVQVDSFGACDVCVSLACADQPELRTRVQRWPGGALFDHAVAKVAEDGDKVQPELVQFLTFAYIEYLDE